MNVRERHIEEDQDVVVVNREVMALLLDAALDKLWYAEQEEGCCPRCCAECVALRRLLESDQLDDLVRSRAEGNDWWDAANNRVDRDWLARAWRFTDCADQHR